jgi:septal ring-binding cell division protein DamX
VAVDSSPSAVPSLPSLPDVAELVRAPPVLTTTPGGADLVARRVVEAAPDIDSACVLPPVDESEEVCVDSGAPVEPDTPEAADALGSADPLEVDSDDADDEVAEPDSSEPDSAEATPYPVRMAMPTPRATASPPTRPMYRAAPITSSWTADLPQQTLASSSRAQMDIRVCKTVVELSRKVDGIQLPRKLIRRR